MTLDAAVVRLFLVRVLGAAAQLPVRAARVLNGCLSLLQCVAGGEVGDSKC